MSSGRHAHHSKPVNAEAKRVLSQMDIAIDVTAPLSRYSLSIQQMVAIARGMMSSPRLIMLDEPSMGLAPKITDMIFERIEEIHSSTDVAILLVEQRVAEALSSCNYGYVLQTGRIALEGPPQQLMEDEHVRAIYLGM